MPFAINDKVLVTLSGTCFGQRIILTHAYNLKTVPSPAGVYTVEMNEIIDEIIPGGATLLGDSYLACLPASYTLTEVRAQQIHLGRFAYVSRAVSAPGLHPSAATVANDSACLTFRTTLAGRKEVANKHIGPAPDAVSAAGLLQAPFKALLNTLGTAMEQPVVPLTTGNTWVPVILHRTALGNTSEITNHRIGDQSRVQRRRTVGLGE